MRNEALATTEQLATFLDSLEFDHRWLEWGMYPLALYAIQFNDFETSGDTAGEHYRYGAVQWWLAQHMDAATVAKLVLLAHLDSDAHMANAALRDIAKRFGAMSIPLHTLCSVSGDQNGEDG